jgi:hypothetical protein
MQCQQKFKKIKSVAKTLRVIVIQKIMRVTRQIVLPLLTKALYKFGFSEEILQKAKFALLLIY